MRFLTSPKVGILLSFVTIATLISAFLVTGVSRSPLAYARSASTAATFQGKHGLGHPAYTGYLNLNSQVHQTVASHMKPLVPYHHGAISFTGIQSNAPLSGITAMGSNAGGVLHNFNGLNSVDSFNVNGFVLEPPDQGLCVGYLAGRKVVSDAINDV